MLENIEVLCHSSVKINGEKIIYIDPFKIEKKYGDADLIFITHEHYDHYSEEDIDKIIKEKTIVIMPESMGKTKYKNVFYVEPNKKYDVDGIKFNTILAYNTNKKFHPKESKWVGYIININDIDYYFAGDTDITEENLKVKCDVAFVPVGGTYTMNAKEAAEFVNTIKPKIAIPIHYGSIVGSKEDAEMFIEILQDEIKGKILMK